MTPQYPLVFSSLLLRAGVGVMVTHIFVSFFVFSPVADWAVTALAASLALLGIITSMLHLGRPSRFFHAFYNLSSPLTWEAFLTPLLLISMLSVGLGAGLPGFGTLGAAGKIGTVVFGIALIYVMGKVYHLKTRPSWSTPLVVYEFFLSAACMGVLGYLWLLSLNGESVVLLVVSLSGIALILLMTEYVLTWYYQRFLKAISPTLSEFPRGRETTNQYYGWIAFGIVVPFLLSAATLAAREIHHGIAFLAFACFLLGSLLWRIVFFKYAAPIKITPDIDME